MDLNNTSTVITVIGGALTTVGGAVYYIQKIVKGIHKSKKDEIEKIINECKELDQIVKNKLETKISVLEMQLENLKIDVNKDLSSLKDAHAIELKNLGERIELLREDLQTQHSQIINLLTKLIT